MAEDGTAFLVMDLLTGLSLEDLVERYGHPMPLPVASKITCELADVLAAAHAVGVVHRDVKPANVFLTSDGEVKVLDFGVARVEDPAKRSARATRAGTAVGTPAFMAPEQARGDVRDVDARSDVWSVGATLFTLATGRLVHEGENAAQIMVRAATIAPSSIAAISPWVPPPIAQIVDRALSFDRAARFASAGELRDALAYAHRACFGDEPDKFALAAFCRGAPGGSRRAPRAACSSGDRSAARPRDPSRATRASARRADRAQSWFGRSGSAPRSSWGRRGCRPALERERGAGHRRRSARGEREHGRAPGRLSADNLRPTAGRHSPRAARGTFHGAASCGRAARSFRSTCCACPSGPFPTPSAPAAACSPPFTVDANGNKHFKPECY